MKAEDHIGHWVAATPQIALDVKPVGLVCLGFRVRKFNGSQWVLNR